MKRIVLAGVLLITVGCAGVRPMTPDVAQTLKGRRTSWIANKKPDFAAMTAGKAAFGMFGAMAMYAAGNEIVAKNKIEDPAVKMSADLTAALRDKLGVSVATAVDPPAEGERTDVYGLAEQHPNADLVLNVQTTNWSFVYFPTDWSHYRVIYSVKAQLIDLKNKKVLAEGTAKRVQDQSPSSPTYDELLASDAARLKAELTKLSDECYQELVRDTFKL